MFSCKFAAYFQTPFSKNTPGWLILDLKPSAIYISDAGHVKKDKLRLKACSRASSKMVEIDVCQKIKKRNRTTD